MDPSRFRAAAAPHRQTVPGRSLDGMRPLTRSLPAVKLDAAKRPLPRPVAVEPLRQPISAASRPPVRRSLPAARPPVFAHAAGPTPIRRPDVSLQRLAQRTALAAGAPAAPVSSVRRPRPVARPKSGFSWHWRYALVPALAIALIIGVGQWRAHRDRSLLSSLQPSDQTASAAIADKPAAAIVTHPTSAEAATYTAAIERIFAANPQVRATVITTNLKTGKQLALGSTEAYTAASTAKLLTAATYFHQVETGKASLSRVMSNGKTAQYNLQQMIILSDNDCWAILNKYLTHAVLSARATALGMEQYNPKTNVLAAADTALLLKQLYDGDLVNATHRDLLMGWMKQANYRQEIVAAVPAEYTVYHKVGVIDDVLHDAAIITKGDEALELVIYTDGTGSYDTDGRIAMIHQITEAALAAYFANASSTTAAGD